MSETCSDAMNRYTSELESLRAELIEKIPQESEGGTLSEDELNEFLSSDELDDKFVKFVVLYEATPKELSDVSNQGEEQAEMIEKMLSDSQLMKEMLVADGASAKQQRKNVGPSQYGQAMKIYTDIQATSKDVASGGVLQRLALAVSLEHAVPIAQTNPTAKSDGPPTVDPVNRYLHFEKAFKDGELDPAFEHLSIWELRHVVDGDECNECLTWGREMLRNFRPDLITSGYGWRYVGLVRSVKYGSENVKYDRPELHKYQNILMNGGVCGRRAFIGRFILRAFGIPTTARPSPGHAALAHWTPKGWTINLGGGWGAGRTKTRYAKDLDFLATTQARVNQEGFLKVKRAQWAGDVLGEKRIYGENEITEKSPGDFWNAVSLRTQRAIIDSGELLTLEALGEDLGEANKPENIGNAPEATSNDISLTEREDGAIVIAAAAYSKPKRNNKEVSTLHSFGGGLQVQLSDFEPQGVTIMRGGTWKNDAESCDSGSRLLSGGYGKYENWGLRIAISGPDCEEPPPTELSLKMGAETMELVYIEPGTFVMGGESEKDGRFQCVEVPKHEVTLTRGYYIGKYPVTQAQYQAVMKKNPSKSTRQPDCPVDTIGVDDATLFCNKASVHTGHEVRLPTEAQWEYASRGGSDTKWFFGNDPSEIGEYAWFKDNAGGKSHPVGEKKPNQFGLYDIYGNVCERISDTYLKNYYAKSPKEDPTGARQGTHSNCEYQVTLPQSGKYSLVARVVSNSYDQRLNVSVKDETVTIDLPFTVGLWQDTSPVTLTFQEGENTLDFLRDNPPQKAIAIKEFILTPLGENSCATK